MSRKLPEIFTGLAVIIIAAVFLVYALGRADAVGGAGYPLTAQFASIGGLTAGADIKIGGVVIGHVTTAELNPQTYAAVVNLQIDNAIKIPNDSSAAITSDGLLSGDYVAVSPGGSDTMLAPGQAFPVTQSAVNIEDLLGKFIFSMGNTSKPSGNQSSSTPSGSNSGSNSGANSGGGISNPAALPLPSGSSSQK